MDKEVQQVKAKIMSEEKMTEWLERIEKEMDDSAPEPECMTSHNPHDIQKARAWLDWMDDLEPVRCTIKIILGIHPLHTAGDYPKGDFRRPEIIKNRRTKNG